MRYIIRCDHTLRTLAWSPVLSRAVACAAGLRERRIPCFVEVSK